jgi:hypothetical protein
MRREWLMKLALGMVVPLAMLAMVSSKAFAEGDEPAKKTTVTGKVAVEKNDAGEVTGVKVGAQKLVLDDKSKELAGKLADKQAEVTGTVDKDGALKLESYKAAEEKKEAAEK